MKLFQPDRRLGVGGRAPVAARGERAAGADFGAVGDGGALELAGLEEAIQKQAEPLLDGGQGVLVLLVVRERVGPCTARFVGPGVVGEEGDFGGAEAVARRVVEVEVLQLVGADLLLGGLKQRGRIVTRMRNEFRRDLGVHDGLEKFTGGVAELLCRDDPAQEILDEGLGDGGVDVVVGHMIADAIRRPPQGQLAQVARTEDYPVLEVRQAE